MNIREPKLFESITFFLKYSIPLTVLVGFLGGCYWHFYAGPKVDAKIRPLIVGIFEIQTTLNKVIDAKIRQEVSEEVKKFEKLLK